MKSMLRGVAGVSCWLAVALMEAFAQAPVANPAAVAQPRLPEMVFYVAKGGSNSCGHGCNEWIAADGTIDGAAAGRLRQLLAKLNGRKLPIFFHSPGGSALGSVELGRLIRSEKLMGGVARTVPGGCDRDRLYDKPCQALKRDGAAAEFDTDVATCNSACVYALAGASVRWVPPGVPLGIHAAEIEPPTPVAAGLLEWARRTADARIEEYLREMGIDGALFAAASAVPHQSARFLQRDEIIRFGIDTREFGDTSWHLVTKPVPAISKNYFARAVGQRLPYRSALLRLSCGDAKFMHLTLAIEIAPGELGFGSHRIVIAMNGWRAEFPLGADTARFDMRTMNVLVSSMAAADDGGSIELFDPVRKSEPQSTVRLTMDGFSDAYARLRKTCEASEHNDAGCVLAGAPPRCVNDAFSASPPSRNQMPPPWPNH
jgi:hypothetical protein